MSDHSSDASRPVISGQVASWISLLAFAAAAIIVLAVAFYKSRPVTTSDADRRVAEKALREDTEAKAQALLKTPGRNADGTYRLSITQAKALIASSPAVLEKITPPVAVVAPAAGGSPAAFVAADAETLKRGAAVYARTCIACHQPTGKGLPPVFPSISETPIIVGNPELPMKFILQGLMGPITVNGTTFNSMMPPVAGVTDQDIADVLTYVRQSFGNKGNPVTAAQVKAVRDANAARTAPWNTAELGLK
jgi:mono/diheme cytochrome c family protein